MSYGDGGNDKNHFHMRAQNTYIHLFDLIKTLPRRTCYLVCKSWVFHLDGQYTRSLYYRPRKYCQPTAYSSWSMEQSNPLPSPVPQVAQFTNTVTSSEHDGIPELHSFKHNMLPSPPSQLCSISWQLRFWAQTTAHLSNVIALRIQQIFSLCYFGGDLAAESHVPTVDRVGWWGGGGEWCLLLLTSPWS